MGNLLSLDPKIHGLRADAKEARRLANGQRAFDIIKWPTPDMPAIGWSVVRLLAFFGNYLHDGSLEWTEARLSDELKSDAIVGDRWRPHVLSTLICVPLA